MDHRLLIDHEFAVSQSGYVVRALLTLHGQAPEAGSRVPLNLSIVLDRSGSMSGPPLESARLAAALLVRRLSPEDVVSVVAYDDQVLTVAEPATGPAQEGLATALDAVQAGGSTNLSGGWLRGRELVARNRRAGAVNRVLLLTDGMANAGITDPELLTGLCAGARGEEITTTTIGFGAHYDERLLRAMADAGGGSAYYIERTDQAPGVFEEEIEDLLSVSAQNVAVELQPARAVRLVTLHNDYPTTPLADGRRVELGDLYAREPKTLLVEFFVPGLDEMLDAPLATITIHAHVLGPGNQVTRRETTINLHATLGHAGHSEPAVRHELLRQEVARAREDALRHQEQGDNRGAGAVLSGMADRLIYAPPPHRGDLEAEIAELRALASQLDAATFDAADAKYLAQRAYNARRGKQGYEEKLKRGE